MSPDASIFSRIADTLESDWRSIARPEQLPPEGSDWTVCLGLFGRAGHRQEERRRGCPRVD
jgi:hypothetical protein